jgi:copper oxidase (laccase) domain-containing protein
LPQSHAGRKSTEKKLLFKLLKKLNQTYHLVDKINQLETPLQIWFGPAICKKCYQIDEKTDQHYDLIAQNQKQILDFFTLHNLDPKKYLSLEIENHCTLHEPEKYYSYRKSGNNVKMNYSFIEII